MPPSTSTRRGRRRTATPAKQIVVKFQNSVQLEYEDGIEGQIRKLGIAPFQTLEEQFPGVTINRLLTSLPSSEIITSADPAIETSSAYDQPNFRSYFVANCPAELDAVQIAEALREWPIVEYAYLPGSLSSPPAEYPPSDPHFGKQGYLRSPTNPSDPPAGIDAEYAWNFPGGAGQGIRFIDIEFGWTLNHEDLPRSIPLLWPPRARQDFTGHGTCILGVIVAVPNNKVGIAGIAHGAKACVVSHLHPSENVSILPAAIYYAARFLSPGDVLLLEAQTCLWRMDRDSPSPWLLPVEVEPAVFDMIRYATARGVVVLEPAADGEPSGEDNTNPDRNNLDSFDMPNYKPLQRGSPYFEDSGAIMVGAGGSKTPHDWSENTNYGSRVDSYAWGDSIWTTGGGTRSESCTKCYTPGAGGTSGSTAVIAGAALIVQGLAEANLGLRYDPLRLRAILGYPPTGTPSGDGERYPIGVMPNLRLITDRVLQTSM